MRHPPFSPPPLPPPTSTLFPYTTLFRSSRRQVVEEEQRLGALNQNVVDAVVDEIGANRAVTVRHERHLQLRADAEGGVHDAPSRSEEHTSELQSRGHLVCRLLLEKKKES